VQAQALPPSLRAPVLARQRSLPAQAVAWAAALGVRDAPPVQAAAAAAVVVPPPILR